MEKDEARKLRALLATHGGEWMWNMGKRVLRPGTDGRGLLKLADWLQECLGQPPPSSDIPDLGGHPPPRRWMNAADLQPTQNYDNDT